DVVGNGVQPVGNGALAIECRRPADQHQKRRLEGVLGIVGYRQHPAANVQHHWAVPLHERRERFLIMSGHVPLEQLPISLGGLVGGDQPAELAEKLAERSPGHRWVLRKNAHLLYYRRRSSEQIPFFQAWSSSGLALAWQLATDT